MRASVGENSQMSSRNFVDSDTVTVLIRIAKVYCASKMHPALAISFVTANPFKHHNNFFR